MMYIVNGTDNEKAVELFASEELLAGIDIGRKNEK